MYFRLHPITLHASGAGGEWGHASSKHDNIPIEYMQLVNVLGGFMHRYRKYEQATQYR